jgi:glycosyltransferase involved in cell wall biosynthesis
MRVLVATEELSSTPSEGLLVFVMHLCRFLATEGEMTALHAIGTPEPGYRSLKILSRKTMLSRELLRFFKDESHDVVIYIPSSGLTGFGLGRAALLRHISNTPSILIALQERTMGLLHTIASQFHGPELILSPSEILRGSLERLGFITDFIMPGYDKRCFTPVAVSERTRLRRKYGIPDNRYIVLHVGHITESRNMQVFLKYRDWGDDIQPVIKCGDADPAWRDRLRRAGVIVIDEFLRDIHEIYQTADCYLFPVYAPTGALEFPLSVIEAMACNLPVMSTRFGALTEVIEEGDGFFYIDKTTEIGSKLRMLRNQTPSTMHKVEDLSWSGVFNRFLAPHLRSLCRTGTGECR